jgi:hypothetical protein
MGCNAVVGNDDITYVERQGQVGEQAPPEIDDTPDTGGKDTGAKDTGADTKDADDDADGDVDAETDGGPSDAGGAG